MDELKKESTGTVLDFHQKQKIESIKKNISIQQRFLFVRELFDENDELFNETIDFLDNCLSNEEASAYLNDRFLNSGKWNNEDGAVIEFLSVIKKKFQDMVDSYNALVRFKTDSTKIANPDDKDSKSGDYTTYYDNCLMFSQMLIIKD